MPLLRQNSSRPSETCLFVLSAHSGLTPTSAARIFLVVLLALPADFAVSAWRKVVTASTIVICCVSFGSCHVPRASFSRTISCARVHDVVPIALRHITPPRCPSACMGHKHLRYLRPGSVPP